MRSTKTMVRRWVAGALLVAMVGTACSSGESADEASETVGRRTSVEAESDDVGTDGSTGATAQESAGDAVAQSAPANPGGATSLQFAEPSQGRPLPPDGPDGDPITAPVEVSGYVEASADNLSTFAMDVDTASYTLARNYLRDGFRPPAGAMRVEEFVNYFDQRYEGPADSAFAINIDGAPTPYTPLDDRTRVVRVGLQGLEVSNEDRKTASLTFVIDISGSMAPENRLPLVKRSLRLLVNNLNDDDQVAIVTYGSSASLHLRPTPVAEADTILTAIDALANEGSTNASAGLQLGYSVAREALIPGGINRVILASDGVANVGPTGPDEILRLIRGAIDDGIEMVSIGVGMGSFNDVLLEQLANDGDGFYAYVDTLREAERLFVDGLVGTLQTIAKQAKVQVEWDADVVDSYRLLGFENRDIADEDFRNDDVDAGEIGAGHSVTALYEVNAVNGRFTGDLGRVSIRWEDPDTGEVTEIARAIRLADLADDFRDAAPTFQLTATVAAFAEILRDSPFVAGVSPGVIADEAERILGLLPDDEDVREFTELTGRAVQVLG